MQKKDITAIVLAALVSMITISGAVAGFYGAFVSRQAIVETQLTHIQAELAKISDALGERETVLWDLSERIVQMETKMAVVERRIEHGW